MMLAAMLVSSVPGTASAEAGSRLWVHRYDGPAHDHDEATDLGVSPDGSAVFVTGTSRGRTGRKDYATTGYDAASGARLWVTRYDGRPNRRDHATDLGIGPDGSKLFVTGYSARSPSDHDFATVAYDAATGDQLWVRRYAGAAHSYDRASAVGVSPDGSQVFVTGFGYGATGSDYVTAAYDASSGAEMWVRRYRGSSRSDAFAGALGVSQDGSQVFVTGDVVGPAGNSDYATVAYDAASGGRLWVRRYDGGNEVSMATDLGVSPDGSLLFVTGFSGGRTSGRDYATVAYDAASGAELWITRYEGPPTRDDFAGALVVSPDGSKVFVTGRSSPSPSDDDYATVAYDAATGERVWVTRYEGPASEFDFPAALGVSPDGSQLFVTGASYGLTGYDYATVAYDGTNGAELWVRRSDPATYGDLATSLGVSPDGSAVFVTGKSWGSTGRLDYLTIAYSVE